MVAVFVIHIEMKVVTAAKLACNLNENSKILLTIIETTRENIPNCSRRNEKMD